MKSDFEKNFYLFFLSKIKGVSQASVWQYISGNLENDKALQIIKYKEKDKNLISHLQKDFAQITDDYISILDKDYPNDLKNIYDPPLFLFYKGNKNLLQSKYLLTIVGSRIMSNYHYQALTKIINGCKNSPLVIVSGLAIGIDSLSHQLALENNLPTIAILGSGIDERVLYPQENISLSEEIIKNKGLILSEYPSLTRPQLHHFPKRNRILAGLSQATIVISGAKKSGTLITSQVAVDEARDVFALPANINLRLSQGPNELIKNGAHILTEANDILRYYQLDTDEINKQIDFKNKTHAKIYFKLQTEPLNLTDLSVKLKLSLAEINILVSELEIQGLVKFNQVNQIEII